MLGLLTAHDVALRIGEEQAQLAMHELDRYGTAASFSLEAFQRHLGIDFRTRTLSTKALWGGLGQSAFVDGVLALVMQFVK
jgi:hypothetical protein